jgi:hypothetical protein
MRTSRSPVAAGFMPACLGRRNIRRRIRGGSRRRPFVTHGRDSAFVHDLVNGFLHPFFSSFILARTPHHAPVKGAATGNAYIAFATHDLRRGLLTCRGFATELISSVPIHPFFSSFILARTPHHAPVKGAATGNANIAFTGSRRLYACVSRSTKYSAKDSGSVTKEAFRVTRSRFCFCA